MKHRDQKAIKSDLEQLDLPLDIVSLMHEGLTEPQAKATLTRFPDLEQAEIIASGFFSMPSGRYDGYLDYLEHMSFEAATRNEPEPTTLFKEEVDERSQGKDLAQRYHTKDRPWNSSHHHEHRVSYEPQ